MTQFVSQDMACNNAVIFMELYVIKQLNKYISLVRQLRLKQVPIYSYILLIILFKIFAVTYIPCFMKRY